MGWGQDYCVSSKFHGIKISHIPILKGICVFFYFTKGVHIYLQSLANAYAVCSKVKCSKRIYFTKTDYLVKFARIKSHTN